MTAHCYAGVKPTPYRAPICTNKQRENNILRGGRGMFRNTYLRRGVSRWFVLDPSVPFTKSQLVSTFLAWNEAKGDDIHRSVFPVLKTLRAI